MAWHEMCLAANEATNLNDWVNISVGRLPLRLQLRLHAFATAIATVVGARVRHVSAIIRPSV